MTITIFTDEVEINAPTQVGLVVTGPVTGVGAGTQLTTTGTGGTGWEILATGHLAVQGPGRLNIRDLASGKDAFTIDHNRNVGIGTTTPEFKLEIDAPDELGLIVRGPVTGVGAGTQLTTTGGGRGWEILATGQLASQGQDKLNIRDLVSRQDVFAIDQNGNVGIGTTSPELKLEIDAPDQFGLQIKGPNAGAFGAGLRLTAVDPGTGPGSSWEILATGDVALQGPGRLNIRNLRTGEDIFTIVTDGAARPDGSLTDAIGIGETAPTEKLEVNGNIQVDNGNVTSLNFLVSSSRELKENITSIGAEEALGALEKLKPVRFNYKTESAAKAHIGFIAEEAPELAATSNGKAISIMDIVAILTRVVKEQQQKMMSLMEKIQMLEYRL